MANVPDDDLGDPPRPRAWWRYVLGAFLLLAAPTLALVAHQTLDPWELDLRFVDPYRPPAPLGEPSIDFAVHRDARSVNPLWTALFGLPVDTVHATASGGDVTEPGEYGLFVHFSEVEGDPEIERVRDEVVREAASLDVRAVAGDDDATVPVERVDDAGAYAWREDYGTHVNFTVLTHRLTVPASGSLKLAWTRPEGWTREELEFLVAKIPADPHPFDPAFLATPVALVVFLGCLAGSIVSFVSAVRVTRRNRAAREVASEA